VTYIADSKSRTAIVYPDMYGFLGYCRSNELQAHVLEYLLTGDPSLIDAKDSRGRGVLHYLATGASSDDETSSAIFIAVEFGADPNERSGWEARGRTPMHIAVEEGQHAALSALLTAGADVDVRDYNGDTPAMAAIRLGRQSMLKVLLP